MAERVKKGLNRYVLAVAFLILIVVIWALKFQSSVSRSLMASKYRTNVAWISGDSLRLVSIEKGEMLVFNIPPTMMMPVVGMKGEIRAGVLRKFSESEGQPLTVIRRSMELLFGTVIDGVIESKEKNGSMVNGVKSDLLSLKIKTDLNPIERLMLFLRVNKLIGSQIKEADIPLALGVVEKLPDGTEVVNVDKTRLNLVVDNGLNNGDLMADTARISIENGSGIDNMGNLAERMIKSAGGFVIEVKSGESHDDWCKFGADTDTVSANRALVDWLSSKLMCVKDERLTIGNENEIKVVMGKKFGEAYRR